VGFLRVLYVVSVNVEHSKLHKELQEEIVKCVNKKGHKFMLNFLAKTEEKSFK
jgi:hypothetical protein